MLDAIPKPRVHQGGVCFVIDVSVTHTLSYGKEYDQCHSIVRQCVKHTPVPYDPPNPDSFRE